MTDNPTNTSTFNKLDAVIAERIAKLKQNSYVASLHQQGVEKINKKMIEEASEVILAAQSAQIAFKKTSNNKGQAEKKSGCCQSECCGDEKEQALKHLKGEVADLWFHTLVLLAEFGLKSDDIMEVLQQRMGTSGILEKQNR